MTPDRELAAFLRGVVGVVDASSYEHHMLWVENQRTDQPRTWEEISLGFGVIVGHLGDRPVCLSLRKAVVDGHLLLFVDPTSQVVDHRLIDGWLSTNLPTSAHRATGSLNRTNAMNFHNVFPRPNR